MRLHPEITAALPSMPEELRRWATEHPAEANAKLAELGGHYLATGRAAPAPGERGYREPAAVAFDPVTAAAVALDAARELFGDADMAMLYARARARLGLASDDEIVDEYEEEEDWFDEEEDNDDGDLDDWRAPEDRLFDLIPIPAFGVGGEALDDDERERRAVEAVMLAAETLDEAWSGAEVGQGNPDRGGSRAEHDIDEDEDRYTVPLWAAVGVLADAWTPDLRYRLVDLTRDDAAAFIAAHHRTLPYLNPRGLKYALGLRYGTRLVAVATAGTPTAPWKRPAEILEVTRIAADGTVKGSASMLMARLIDLSRVPGGPQLVVTYSLLDERGTTYRALREKGLRPTMIVPGKVAGGGGRRRSADRESLPTVDKVRWEAGPRAGVARWDLIPA